MKKSSRYAALRYRDFRLLWFGQLVSTTGNQMMIVALNWHIYLLTKSALSLGMLGLVRFFPIIIFSLIAGNIADAHNRKKIQFLCAIALGILAVILAALTYSDMVTPMIIYILTGLSAIFSSLETPARQAFLPKLVKREHLPNAFSLNIIMWQTATIIGPAAAGFLIAELGVGSIYVFDAISFAAVLISLALIQTKGAIEGTVVKMSIHSILEGLHFVKSKSIIWSTMLLDFFSTFFSSAYALLPIFAQDILHVGPQGLGILFAAPSIGAVGAGFVMAHMQHIKRQGVILLVSVGLYGFATILFGISKSFTLSLFALFLIGVGDSVSAIIRNTVRQIATPDYMRGRMTGVNMIFFKGGPQLGEFEAGLLAAAIGGPWSVVIGGIGTVVAVGVMAYVVPTLRKYQGDEVLT
jgi:MFS family permease